MKTHTYINTLPLSITGEIWEQKGPEIILNASREEGKEKETETDQKTEQQKPTQVLWKLMRINKGQKI